MSYLMSNPQEMSIGQNTDDEEHRCGNLIAISTLSFRHIERSSRAGSEEY